MKETMKNRKETLTEQYLREILELLKLRASQPIFPHYSNFNEGTWGGSVPPSTSNFTGCPPHNFVLYQYQGTWGGSVPPLTMRCTKCLRTA